MQQETRPSVPTDSVRDVRTLDAVAASQIVMTEAQLDAVAGGKTPQPTFIPVRRGRW